MNRKILAVIGILALTIAVIPGTASAAPKPCRRFSGAARMFFCVGDFRFFYAAWRSCRLQRSVERGVTMSDDP